MEKKEKRAVRSSSELKRKYRKPALLVLGSVNTLTLKGGSVSDFGTNQFQA